MYKVRNTIIYVIIVILVVINCITIGAIFVKDYNETDNYLNVDTTINNNTNVKTAKDKIIDNLLVNGYIDYNDDEVMYYKATAIPGSLVGDASFDCTGGEIVNFRDKYFSTYFVCHKYNVQIYQVENVYYWKDNANTFESIQYDDTGNRIVEKIRAYIDENGNLNCQTSNCEYTKENMLEKKNIFMDILYNSDVSLDEIS